MKKHVRCISKCFNKHIKHVVFILLFLTLAFVIYIYPALRITIFDNIFSKYTNSERLVIPSFDVTGYTTLHSSLDVQHYENCEVNLLCATDSLPVHLYTGWKNIEAPKICINGNKLSTNDIGRGLNVVIIDNKTMVIIRRGYFDMFVETSTRLEIFLEVLRDGDIVVIVTHDEASSGLSVKARNLLSDLGSSYIQDLDYRDMWIFVGQKGINGFSNYEYIKYLMPGNVWSESINKSFCVQKKIIGTAIRPDAASTVVAKKGRFCSMTLFNESWCTGKIEDPDWLYPNIEASTSNDSVNKIPIVLIPGPDVNIFKMQIEALMSNGNVNLSNIYVFSPEDETNILHFAHSLKFKVHNIGNSTNFYNYTYVFIKSLEKAQELFYQENYYIILEEGVIPSNGFLDFMASALEILDENDTLSGASAWNDNDHAKSEKSQYKETSMSRRKLFPGLGMLIRHSTLDKHSKNKLKARCHKRLWDFDSPVDMIVPDISRAFKIVSPLTELQDPDSWIIQNTYIEHALPSPIIHNLTFSMQDSLLAQEMAYCVVPPNENIIRKCLMMENDNNFTTSFSHPVCVHYEQENAFDSKMLAVLLSCFKVDDMAKFLSTEGYVMGFY